MKVKIARVHLFATTFLNVFFVINSHLFVRVWFPKRDAQ